MRRTEAAGVASALAGACLWGIVWLPLAALERRGLAGLWTTFAVFGLVGLAILPGLVRGLARGTMEMPWRPALVLLVFGGLTNFLFFLALTKTSVVRALLFFYLSPVWNLLAARIWGGIPLTGRKVGVVALSLTGASVLLGLHHLALVRWSWGDTMALGSGLAFAASVVGLKGLPHAPAWSLAGLNWLGSALLAAAGLALSQPPLPGPVGNWL
ncbi:MAG: DMT family transporter, partial [Thermodesulfobacteriota bacterium]